MYGEVYVRFGQCGVFESLYCMGGGFCWCVFKCECDNLNIVLVCVKVCQDFVCVIFCVFVIGVMIEFFGLFYFVEELFDGLFEC